MDGDSRFQDVDGEPALLSGRLGRAAGSMVERLVHGTVQTGWPYSAPLPGSTDESTLMGVWLGYPDIHPDAFVVTSPVGPSKVSGRHPPDLNGVVRSVIAELCHGAVLGIEAPDAQVPANRSIVVHGYWHIPVEPDLTCAAVVLWPAPAPPTVQPAGSPYAWPTLRTM